MRSKTKMLLCMCMLLVMVICSACTNSNVQVTIGSDGETRIVTESLVQKSVLDRLIIAAKQASATQENAGEAEQSIAQLEQMVGSLEVVMVDNVEYYKETKEEQFSSYKEAEKVAKESLRANGVSIGEDHMYLAYYVNEEAAQVDTSMLSAYEMYLNMYGFTLEETQEMLKNAIVNVKVSFQNPITYSNGVISEDGTQVCWSFTQEEINTLQQGVRVFYAETTETSKIEGDTVAPKFIGIKNKGYYKQASIDVSDNVGVAAVVLNGLATESGVQIGFEGKHTLEVYDYNNNVTKCSFVVDFTKPKVKGVANNKTYKGKRTIKFSDKYGIKSAKLNGKKIKNSKVVSKKGSYTLKVTDKAGNTTTVKFKIKK